jgi:DNA replication protein DnaC
MSQRPRRPKWSTPKNPPQNRPQATATTARQQPTATPAPPSLRDQILSDFSDLRVPLSAEDFDAALRRAEQEGLSHLEFLRLVISQQAQGRRERAIERRIRQAYFAAAHTLEDFDWKFNARTIDRVQIEALASGEFVRRHDNLVFVGQSGLGKSHILQGLGRRFCALGYHVRYTTSADLLVDLTAALADRTLPQRLRYWCRFDLVIIDEFGFDKLERSLSPQAANLLYKVIDARHGQNSTALATNIDFDFWGEYLGDPPLAMAFMDRIVDGALLMKLEGESYRANRAKRLDANRAKKAG